MSEGITKILFADREAILLGVLEQAGESSTWISECSLTPADKEAAVVLLAEISGAVRLAKKLLMLDEWENLQETVRKEFADDIG